MDETKYPGFVLRHAAGQWRLLDLTHPEIPYKAPLCINETGAEIWQALDIGKEPREIAENISKECDVDFEQVFSDVNEFIGKLVEFGVPLNE